jgi:hypothetical protein
MKKLLFLGATATLALASCKKDYICECKAIIDNEIIEDVSTTKTITDTETNAKKECDKNDIADSGNGGVECQIK